MKIRYLIMNQNQKCDQNDFVLQPAAKGKTNISLFPKWNIYVSAQIGNLKDSWNTNIICLAINFW